MEIVHETVYEHTEGSEIFTVTAIEKWSINMIRKLKVKFPDDVDIRHENNDGSIVVRLPSEWMRIVPKRHDNMSENARQLRRERMKALRATQTTE